MKATLIRPLLILLSLGIFSCGQKQPAENDAHHHHGSAADSTPAGNGTLYKEVMNVHNEVMPKMDDIFKIKEALKKKVASTPSMPEDKKQQLQTTIIKLDSASEAMMIWMRQFNPQPDSANQTEAKAYLENEMVKVKKVRQDILDAIEKGKSLQ
ncbi:MAG: hypothetical protein WKF87_10760 [Chryseolinea sp.]